MSKSQPSLFPSNAIVDLGNLKEHTASSPRIFFVPDSGRTYVVKSQKTNPAEPYTPANEFLAWGLAKELGLPIPESQLFDFDGEKYFGSLIHQPTKLWCPPVLQNLISPNILFDIISFDIFACNTDRHLNNLIFTENNNLTYNVHIIDHGRCFFGEATGPELFKKKDVATDISGFVKIVPYLINNHLDISHFESALQRIEQLTTTQLRSFVQNIPSEFLAEADKLLAETILDSRKSRIRGLLTGQIQFFQRR